MENGLLIGSMMIGLGYSSRKLESSLLMRLMIGAILVGLSVSMVINWDQAWWEFNFSFLGTPEATKSWIFNLTLLISAVLFVSLIDTIFRDLFIIFGRGSQLKTLRTLLLMCAFCLGGVGFFPYNESGFSQQMHNLFAVYLAFLFFVLIMVIHWLLPMIEQRFMNLSYAIGVGLLSVIVLYQGLSVLSLTALEVGAFFLIFSWLILLLHEMIHIVSEFKEV